MQPLYGQMTRPIKIANVEHSNYNTKKKNKLWAWVIMYMRPKTPKTVNVNEAI